MLQMNGFYGSIVPGSTLIKVKGIAGAREYPTPPNTPVPMFDEDEDILYVKHVDQNNYATVRAYSLTEIDMSPSAGGMVTEKEFKAFKEEVLDGQRNIQSILESFGSSIAKLQAASANVRSAEAADPEPEPIDVEYATIDTGNKSNYRSNKRNKKHV